MSEVTEQSLRAGSLQAVPPVLVAEHLHKSFGGVRAVRDVSIELPTGQITALIGPNGAGKTTVFNLLTGRIRPDSGTITFDGRDVSVEPVRRRARAGLGRTFQDVRLFESLTVLENVAVYAQSGSTQSLAGALARPIRLRKQDRVAKERARTALAYVDAERLADRVASSLSYAEQKIVSIARLLAMDSRVLLLDEPASGVDEQGRERLLSILEKVSGEDGRTVCLVEHNLDVVRRLADSVVFIAEGAVVAAGDPTTIFESRELAELYLGDRRGR